jgi:ABC-type antimicrobial peptide transport system permease subunit
MVKAPESRPSTEELQAAIAGVDRDIPLHDVIAMQAVVSRAGAGYRFLTMLLVGFAAFAVLLCATGLYSTLAYAVSRRAREIAIRVALGAEGKAVLGLILIQGGRLVALGLAAGLLASVLTAWALASQMFGVASADPITYAGVLVVFGITAFAAMLLPGRQALRLDPAHVLRNEA